MSEPAATQRVPIDLDEFERRLRGPSSVPSSQEDPLAELARLVGGGDRFMTPPVGLPKATYLPRVVSPLEWQTEEQAELPQDAAFDPGSLGETLSEPMADFAADGAPSFEEEQFYSHGPIGMGGDRPPQSRRALYLMGGSLALVLAGIAVTFAMRSHAPAAGEAPTIKAATGPTKVQPASPDTTSVADRNASLLDRSGAGRDASSRVVDNREQPVDLQSIRSSRSGPVGNAADGVPTPGAAPSAAAAGSFFPEPKRVHTVSVRPDGTIIDSTPPPLPPVRSVVASNDSAAVVRAAAVGGQSAANASVTTEVPALVARPATPKTTARVVTTPKPTAFGAGLDTPPVPVANIPLKPHSTLAAPIKPTRVADATASGNAGKVASVASSAGGNYAVQLAAPASEQDAKDTGARLEKKFSGELGGRHTAVEKADSNGHTVYRVRVVGLGSDDANVLCSRLKAGGGACFVARN